MTFNSWSIVVGTVGIGVVVLRLVLMRVIDIVGDVTLYWLNGSYERSLHNAVSECYREELSESWSIWWGDLRFLAELPLLRWLPRVRKRLLEIHAKKEEKFDGVVQIDADLRHPRHAMLRLRPWTVVLLDGQGNELRRIEGLTRLNTGDRGYQEQWFREVDEATTLLVIDHHGRLVRKVEIEKVWEV